ncbi:suppressor protein STP22 of temperature-sensitive alpha-factor receptor and arginine permease-like isoform X1 [Macadamia integrifolia]|uniref:suppressor protein STP22 of temperature-sensitive alpha-factor receptor and arginine permease-like isoform X1 n=1 Tax=Macadamia integrifolia TaxID=60698 RepID=UPI001C4F6C36|nr:suppressor protein STP22 of temperature-sensitive alpha-factor receptor and arginine permease-like isoform X1 [Macadamia integrifolia]
MGEEEEEPNLPPSPHRPSSSSQPTTNGEDAPPSPPPPPPPPPQPRFDPSRMIGIIKRKALIKDLAAVYHAECLSYCQQLLELQKKREEVPYYKAYVCINRTTVYHQDVMMGLIAFSVSISICGKESF